MSPPGRPRALMGLEHASAEGSPMSFHARRTVRFADCDLAGIVYFPQYLVMTNTLVEQWFDEGLGVPYAAFLGPRSMGLRPMKRRPAVTSPRPGFSRALCAR